MQICPVSRMCALSILFRADGVQLTLVISNNLNMASSFGKGGRMHENVALLGDGSGVVVFQGGEPLVLR